MGVVSKILGSIGLVVFTFFLNKQTTPEAEHPDKQSTYLDNVFKQ